METESKGSLEEEEKLIKGKNKVEEVKYYDVIVDYSNLKKRI